MCQSMVARDWEWECSSVNIFRTCIIAVVYLPKDFTFSCRFRTAWIDKRRFGLFGWVPVQGRRLHRVVGFHCASSSNLIRCFKLSVPCDSRPGCRCNRKLQSWIQRLKTYCPWSTFRIVLWAPFWSSQPRASCRSKLYPRLRLRDIPAKICSQNKTAANVESRWNMANSDWPYLCCIYLETPKSSDFPVLIPVTHTEWFLMCWGRVKRGIGRWCERDASRPLDGL